MTAAAPLPGSRASVLAEHATPGRVASFALHVVFGAALLTLPRPMPAPEPPVVRVDVIPPPAVEPPPPPEPRTAPRRRQPPPSQTRQPTPAPPTPDDAEPLPRPTTAPRAQPLTAARAATAPIAEANQDAPFLADQAERAETLRPATTAAPALSSMAADTPWIGGAAERTEALTAATSTVTPRDLANAKAAPDQLQFAPEPTTTPAATPGQANVDDAKKRAEDEARKRAGLNEPKSDRGDAPLAAGGGAAGARSGGPAAAAGGGAPAASGGGVRAAIRGISIDGLNENVGCDNPDDVRLSEDERAACNRRRWAGARGAPELGAVKARDQRVFDAAAARKTPPTGQKGVGACRGAGAAGASDCLPDADPSARPSR